MCSVSFGDGVFFCFKQKTAYEMRISDWSSDVCSSDLRGQRARLDRLLLAVDGHRRTLGPGRNAQLHREAAIAGLAHRDAHGVGLRVAGFLRDFDGTAAAVPGDRKSKRLNSSH